MSSFERMPLRRAQMIADRFMAHLGPYVSLMCIAGSVRRECSDVGDIEVVCVPNDDFSMGLAFPMGYPGLTVNGTRLKRFIYPESGVQFELYITNEKDYGRILAIRTGSADYSHFVLAVRWGRLGWTGTEDGLRRKVECDHKSTWRIKPEFKNCPTIPPNFTTEEDFFAFLGVPWVHPKARNYVKQNSEFNYKH